MSIPLPVISACREVKTAAGFGAGTTTATTLRGESLAYTRTIGDAEGGGVRIPEYHDRIPVNCVRIPVNRDRMTSQFPVPSGPDE